VPETKDDEDLWCTKCGDKDPDHLAEVVKYLGCRRSGPVGS
jgi:hypothetical protein